MTCDLGAEKEKTAALETKVKNQDEELSFKQRLEVELRDKVNFELRSMHKGTVIYIYFVKINTKSLENPRLGTLVSRHFSNLQSYALPTELQGN